MICSRTTDVHRYHDGELPAGQRAAVEAHLAACADCSGLLSDLRRLASLVRSVPPSPLPAGAMRRYQDVWRRTRERSVIRIASWLTTAAAAVLVLAVASRPTESPGAMARQPDIWETVATLPPVDAREDGNADLVVLAQWMADDLSPHEPR